MLFDQPVSRQKVILRRAGHRSRRCPYPESRFQYTTGERAALLVQLHIAVDLPLFRTSPATPIFRARMFSGSACAGPPVGAAIQIEPAIKTGKTEPLSVSSACRFPLSNLRSDGRQSDIMADFARGGRPAAPARSISTLLRTRGQPTGLRSYFVNPPADPSHFRLGAHHSGIVVRAVEVELAAHIHVELAVQTRCQVKIGPFKVRSIGAQTEFTVAEMAGTSRQIIGLLGRRTFGRFCAARSRRRTRYDP